MMQLLATSSGHIGIAIRRRLAWPHPEWWALALSAVAWLAIVSTTLFASASGVGHHAASSPSFNVIGATRDWMLMTLAMMVPLSTGAMRATADRSLWRRRHRAIAGWLIGFVAIWLVFGIAVSLASMLLTQLLISTRAAAAIMFLLAAGWELAPPREHALAGCHHTQPLAPAGWRADYDCVRYGWTTGVWCMTTCGVLMVACSLVGHNAAGLNAMGMATLIGFAERYAARPDPRCLATAIVITAAIALSLPTF